MNINVTKAWVLSCFLIISINTFAASLARQTTDNGIDYVMGGIGIDEAQALDMMAKDYPLRLLFSQGQCGHAIADITVDIYDAKQNVVFHLDHAEPQLLINLDKGRYRVVADNNGLKQGHRFSLSGNNHQKVVLNWKDCVDVEVPNSANE